MLIFVISQGVVLWILAEAGDAHRALMSVGHFPKPIPIDGDRNGGGDLMEPGQSMAVRVGLSLTVVGDQQHRDDGA